MERFKTYTLIGETAMILLLAWLLWGTHKADSTGTPLPSDDKLVSRETFTPPVMKRLSKKQASHAGLITKDVAKDEGKSVLATGTVKDDSGSRTVAAVLDEEGNTKLVEKRPFAEQMSRHEIGAGIAGGTLGVGWAGEYRYTYGRASSLYGDLRLNGWKYEFGPRLNDGHKYDGMATVMMTLRF